MKLLLTGAIQWTETQKNELQQLGHQISYIQDERIPLKKQGFSHETIAKLEGVIANGLFLYNDIREFSNLKYIQLTSAGLDRVPIDYIEANHITLYNARGVYSIPMAEFALSGVLQLYKHSRFFMEKQVQHCWEKKREMLELYGKTVCILGCGNVGQECAKRFMAFGCQVIGIDVIPFQSSIFTKIDNLEKLDDYLASSDIVVLTLPLTEKTRCLMNKEHLACMRPKSILVNIARGGVVDTDALIDALENQLLGAVLDVFEEEPLDSNSPLWNMECVILTPHNSFIGEGNRKRLQTLIVKNLENYAQVR